MGNLFITIGGVMVLLGILVNVLSRFHIPLLPGDIFIQKENFTFYFPIVTSILLSILLTIILNLFHK